MYHSKDAIVRSYFNHAILDAIVLVLNLLFYGLLVLIFLSRSYVMLLSMFHKLESLHIKQQADIENLRNLIFVRSDQSFIEGFDNTEIDCMIQYITGH